MNTFTFTQSTAATTWTVNHPFNGYPALDVITNYPGVDSKIMPTSVTYTGPGQVVIKFSTAVAGSVTMAGNYVYTKNLTTMPGHMDASLNSVTQ